jgi:peptidoglycan lytic transglycosylase
MAELRLLCVIGLCAALSACASTHVPPGSGTYRVGSPYQVNGVWYTPHEQPHYDKVGLASWYGPGFHGNRTADGEIFNQYSLTAAHATLPLPVNVRVTNLENGRSLVVRVNDRGPFHSGRIIDVSERAAELLGFKEEGTARVRVEYIGRADQNAYTMEASSEVPKAAPTTRVSSAALPDDSAGETAAAQPAPSMAPIPNPAPSMTPDANSAPPVKMMDPVANPAAAAGDNGAAVAAAELSDSANPQPSVSTGQMYVQVGAYTDAHSAMMLYNQILGVGKTTISPTDQNGTRIYRVRVGPVADADEASRITANLKALGHDDVQIVME